MDRCIKIKSDFDDFFINKQYDKVVIITDDNVGKLYLKSIGEYIENYIVYSIIPGESSKSINTYEKIIKFCIENNISRKSLIIALGGGVVGDISGFVASTYMRGLDYINIPTTLLAQVDSSIGGKCGVNLNEYKNIIGSFYSSTNTYINVSTLKTLNAEDFLSGMCEVIKYAFISDYSILNYLTENKDIILNKDLKALKYIVKKCVSIKMDIVKQDEKENGIRRILNLGHSFGHPIEKMIGLSHGKSIAIGTIMAFRLSYNMGIISKKYYDESIKIYDEYEIDKTIEIKDIDLMIKIMKKDKKNNYNKFNLVLPVGLGKVDVFDIEEDDIKIAIKEILCIE